MRIVLCLWCSLLRLLGVPSALAPAAPARARAGKTTRLLGRLLGRLHRPLHRPLHRHLRAAPVSRALCLGLAAAALPLQAATAVPPAVSGIYTCIDEQGRRLTADRPIAACSLREQRILNSDGSLRGILPPTLTVEERAEKDARDRRAAQQRAAQADAIRRDRNLMQRYVDEAAHQRAREAALDTVRLAMKASEARLRELAVERQPLLDDTEFYKGRALPFKLRTQLDANDASVEAQQSAVVNQQAELVRINRMYDNELERLRRLWAGAMPGSMGPPAPSSNTAAAPAAPQR